MGGGEQGQEMGPGRPSAHGRGCLEGMARGPDAQVPPYPSQAQHEVPWTLGGQAWRMGGWGRRLWGHRAQTFHRLYLRVFIKCGRLKKIN